jgi:aminoglycoside phosphotransferase (APT) family kinase protein
VQMHPEQLSVTEATVRALVAEQFPRWQSLEIRAVHSAGTVNALFRIGEAYVARLPLVAGELDVIRRSLESEAAAARELLGRTRFPTPEPVAIGEPGAGYPMPWSVQTWLPGTVAWDADPGSSVGFAHDLAEFIGDLRSIPTGGRTFDGPGRGGDLRRHDAWVAECLRRSADLLDVASLQRLWERFRDLPAPGRELMTHGDLIPGNVLVTEGRLTGVLDVGGLGPADPALDLVGAWHLLESGPRQILRAELGCGDLEWARGAAWAFEQALGAAWYYARSNPAMSLMGRRTLHRITIEPPRPP